MSHVSTTGRSESPPAERWTVSPAAEEARAFRVGAYAQGLTGMRLQRVHIPGTPVDDPVYPAMVIAHASLRGYSLGVRRAIESDPRFAKLDENQRRDARNRVGIYLGGFYDRKLEEADAFAKSLSNPQPTSLLARTFGRLENLKWTLGMTGQRLIGVVQQRREQLTDPYFARYAGQMDAYRDLAPQGRISQLLVPVE